MDTQQFFVPASTPETQEQVYSEFAKWSGRSVPPHGERIYSISYNHDGVEWIATVGETLHGTRERRSRTGFVTQESVADRALVLAIFPGVPYMVVTNFRIDTTIHSDWENPFMAGQPSEVIRFSS